MICNMKQICLYGEDSRITKVSRHIGIIKSEHSNIAKQPLLSFLLLPLKICDEGREVFISLRPWVHNLYLYLSTLQRSS